MIERLKFLYQNPKIQEMRYDRLWHVWESFLHFLFPIYVLLVEFVYTLLYIGKSRTYISTQPNNPVLTQSATCTHREIIEGKITCLQVVDAFIERLEEVDKVVNGICYRNYSTARTKAQAIDEMLNALSHEKRNELSTHRPFLGVPITVKNNINVKGFRTTCGWFKQKDNVATEDAPSVQRMREAGAIIVALTNVPEFCLWIETSNSMFGQTNNPYDTRRTCGGSSGGEAALIASGASVIGIGTDIAGSIRVPCMFSGLFGLKPSVGISPIDGLFPIDQSSRASMQTVGPMCRYAEDLEPMFKAICLPSKFTQLLPSKELKEIKFFSFPGFRGGLTEKLTDEQRSVFDKTISFFEKEFKRPIPSVDIPYQDQMYEIVAIFLQDGLEKPYCDIMEGTKNPREFVVDGVKTIFGSKDTKLSKLSLQVNVNSIFMHGTTKEQVEKAIKLRDQASAAMCELLGDDGILCIPGWPTPAPHHNVTVWKHSTIAQTAVWNALGMPVITVPLGLSKQGLPLSVQFTASKNNDLTLLKLAEYLDGHSNHCINPEVFPGFVAPWTLNQ
ncbi:unnamed protein product, partial [Mesorhabditis belari]|uniref:Amidase domain-containing protein n=1 Tax=Mesorhabditis belari TaxID=2138241 RepID=A0AAF3J2B5_9BILA